MKGKEIYYIVTDGKSSFGFRFFRDARIFAKEFTEKKKAKRVRVYTIDEGKARIMLEYTYDKKYRRVKKLR